MDTLPKIEECRNEQEWWQKSYMILRNNIVEVSKEDKLDKNLLNDMLLLLDRISVKGNS